MALFKISKGQSSSLPKTYNDGYCYVTTDDGKMYIDTTNTSAGRIVLNAGKADKLAQARKIELAGDATGSVNFDGSSNVKINVTISELDTLQSAIDNLPNKASNGIIIDDKTNTIKHSNTITEGTASEGGTSRTLEFGSSFNIPGVTYDAQGHITGKTGISLTLPPNPNTDTRYNLSGALNSSGQYIITLDPTSGEGSFATVPKMIGATSTTAGTGGLVPAATSANRNKYLRGDGTWDTPTNTTYPNVTTSKAGLMTSADKAKLDTISSGAEVNQNAFSHIFIDSTSISAATTTDSIVLVSGENVTLSSNEDTNAITISATDTKYSAATSSAPGLMSADDKKKLDGISSSANKYTLPTATASTLGGVKIGSNITVDSGTISITKNNVTSALGYTPETSGAAASALTSAKAYTDQIASGKSNVGHSHTKSEITDFPSSLKNPASLTIQGNGTTLTNGVYDGSAAKTVNITPASIGIAYGTAVSNVSTTSSAGTSTSFARGDHQHAITSATIKSALGTSSTGTKFFKEDGTWSMPANATSISNGLMSSSDKSKLDGLNNYTLPAATASTLGGVKSGGDVSISSGVITVNDNSHNHTIANVTSLQSALDGKSDSNHTHSNLTIGSKIYNGSSAISIAASDLGLASALRFKGSVASSANLPSTGLNSGDVYLVNGKEYAYYHDGTSGQWIELGDESSFKLKQDAVSGATSETGSTIRFVNDISQDTNGVITATTKTVRSASSTQSGLMSSGSYRKLSGISSGAEVNQNAFSNITVGSTTLAAASKTDTVTLAAGDNVTLTTDSDNNTITIASTDTNTTYTFATGSTKGTISVTPSNGTATDVAVKGLGPAAYADVDRGISIVDGNIGHANNLEASTGTIQMTRNSSAATFNLPTIKWDAHGHIVSYKSSEYTLGENTSTSAGVIPACSSSNYVWATNANGVPGWRSRTFDSSDTWHKNTATQEGVVSSGSGHVNKVWKTDAKGNPGWRDDANDNTWVLNDATTSGIVAAGAGNANKVWKTDAKGVPAWRNDADTATYPTINRITTSDWRPILMGATSITPGTSVSSFSGKTLYQNENVLIHPGSKAILAQSYRFVDATGAIQPMMHYNDSNIWIGATQTGGGHFKGGVCISTGYNGKRGNPTINISIANSANTGATNYKVLHSKGGEDGGLMNGPLFLQDTSITKGTNPKSTNGQYIGFFDKTGVAAKARTGMLYSYVTSGGQSCMKMYAYQFKSGSSANTSLYVAYNADGTKTAGTDAKFYGAVWNDYAEFRRQEEKIEPGYCVTSKDDGKVHKTTKKFEHCEGVVSDTFGFAIGQTEECQTPLAVAGRVLVYCDGDRYDYHAGDVVCAGPEGKVYKMTDEEICKYPHRIVGTVSEIPEYEIWGEENISVNRRIWINVK